MFARTLRQCVFAGLVGCVGLSTPAIADRTEAKQPINLPAGDLITALELLAQQSGIEFVYDAAQLKGVKTHGAIGILAKKEAVLKLLEGTQLSLTVSPGGAMLIAAPPKVSNAEKATERPSANSSAPESFPQTTGPATSSASGLEPIVITGTHIAGVAPVGSALIAYTHADIEASGTATLDQFARQLPQNFSGADTIAMAPNANASLGRFQQGAATNIFAGAGFNLNGLGPGSTLTLLNGHRLAAGALDGSLVDISQIPLSAIDHIEVLDDGASAVYGSDAVAGVVNIFTRQNFDGAQTSFRYGGATQSGANEYTASQLLGHSWGTGNALLDYEYDDQGGLDASQRHWIGAQSGPFSLIPESRRHGLIATASQGIGTATTLSGDLLYSDRAFKIDSTLTTPEGIAEQSSTGHARQSAVIVSLDRGLFTDWHANITASYSGIQQLDDIDTSFAPSGLPDSTAEQRRSDTALGGIDGVMSGTLFELPGGKVKALFGGSFRTEHFKGEDSIASTGTAISMQRDVASGYGEIRIPVVGVQNAQTVIRRLEVSIAYRHDHYSDFQSAASPKVGMMWEPVSGFQVRGTYGTSFHVPYLAQLGTPVTSTTTLIPNAGSPGGRIDVLEFSGGNSALHPETARSLTVGVDFEPTKAPGLALSLTYFNVLLKGQIQYQIVTSQPLLSQPLLIPFLQVNPPLNFVQSFFNSSGFQGDRAGLGPSGVGVIFDNRLANIAETTESGLNFSAQYVLPTSYGQFNIWTSGTHLLRDQIRAASYVDWLDVENTIAEPTSWKARAGVGWSRGGFASSLTMNYVNAYDNTLFTPAEKIDSWTTADCQLSFDTKSAASWLGRHLKMTLSVQNLFDKDPPFLRIPTQNLLVGQKAIPYDGSNASPVGRLISIQVTKGWLAGDN
jgi:iron complex outermembrane receptor protein